MSGNNIISKQSQGQQTGAQHIVQPKSDWDNWTPQQHTEYQEYLRRKAEKTGKPVRDPHSKPKRTIVLDEDDPILKVGLESDRLDDLYYRMQMAMSYFHLACSALEIRDKAAGMSLSASGVSFAKDVSNLLRELEEPKS